MVWSVREFSGAVEKWKSSNGAGLACPCLEHYISGHGELVPGGPLHRGNHLAVCLRYAWGICWSQVIRARAATAAQLVSIPTWHESPPELG